jgi:hypothetical protein
VASVAGIIADPSRKPAEVRAAKNVRSTTSATADPGTWESILMKRLIAGAALVGALGLVPVIAATGVVNADDDAPVTMTIGLLQDLSSPNVTVGYLVSVYELWNLQYATLTDKAADDFSTIPGLAESWEAQRRRSHLHLHVA